MKFRNITSAAALAGLAATAAAQSSVTIYGKVDLGLRKPIGTDNKELATGSDGRLGFRGTEDLGNGMKAFFNFEHRFFPNNGTQDGSQFWKGVSRVGLAGGFGSIALGRQQIAAFTLVQDQVDPFGADTVAGLRDQGMRVGGITKVRVDNSIRYDFSAAGFNFAASIAEAEANAGVDRPVSLAVNYAAGPLFLAAGIEDPAGATDRQWNLGAAYSFGAARLSAGVANGKTNAGVAAKGFLVGLNMTLPRRPEGRLRRAEGRRCHHRTKGRPGLPLRTVQAHHGLCRRGPRRQGAKAEGRLRPRPEAQLLTAGRGGVALCRARHGAGRGHGLRDPRRP
jgi:predicted porin